MKSFLGFFAVGCLFLNSSFVSAETMESSSMQSRLQTAEHMAQTLNRYQTYESFWKTVKVKDPEAYSTLSNFLFRHGKKLVPSAEASMDRVYLFSVHKGQAKKIEIQVLQSKPLIISYQGKAWSIRSTADAIKLLEIREKPRRKLSLLEFFLGNEAIAQAPAPAAAPVAVTAMSVFVPLAADSKYHGEPFDLKKSLTGNAIAQVINGGGKPLSCELYLAGQPTLIPVDGQGQTVKFQATEQVETFTFPNYNGNFHLKYRRSKEEGPRGIPDDEQWFTCESEACKTSKPFNPDKELGETSLMALEFSPAKKKLMDELQVIENEYKVAAKNFDEKKYNSQYPRSLLAMAEDKKYPKTNSIETLVKQLINRDDWKDLAKEFEESAKKSKETQSKAGTLEPVQKFTIAQMQKFVQCTAYERFQEETLYKKEKCHLEIHAIGVFQAAIGPHRVNQFIDATAAVLRPLTPPNQSAAKMVKHRTNARQDLFFFSSDDAKIHEAQLEPSFQLVKGCNKVSSLAQRLGGLTNELASELSVNCLKPEAFIGSLESVRKLIKSEAPGKALNAFNAGPVAVARFASVVARCCKSEPCAKGISTSNEIHMDVKPEGESKPAKSGKALK